MGTNLDAAVANGAARAYAKRPIPWVHHDAANAGNPCINQLISVAGVEGYGRFWRLVELLLQSETHAVPSSEEQGYRRFSIGLGFKDMGDFESFISLLIDLELIAIDGNGRRSIPIVDEAALKVGMSAYNGAKGGKAAAANRRKQARQPD